MSVAASLVVTFGDGVDSSDLVVMEFDAAMNLDAAGEEKHSLLLVMMSFSSFSMHPPCVSPR